MKLLFQDPMYILVRQKVSKGLGTHKVQKDLNDIIQPGYHINEGKK